MIDNSSSNTSTSIADSAEAADAPSPIARKIGLVLGTGFFLMSLLSAPPEGLSREAWIVCGLALWMASWWITEAVPLPVTSLLPLFVLPVWGILPLKEAALGFSADIVFLFLGGFILAIAMEKWRLHLRIGLGLLSLIGRDAKSILAGLMLATGFMGMWISNTATTIMMMPMALSVALVITKYAAKDAPQADKNAFVKAVVLGVAYAPCIGGLATFIGTPTNAVLEGFVSKTYQHNISLADWMSFGVPVAALLLFIAWLLLCIMYLAKSRLSGDIPALLREQYNGLGPMQRGEALTLLVFLGCLFCWKFGFLLEDALGITLDDAVIAIMAALLLFILPLDRKFESHVLNWKDTQKLPWGILLFFGGSISLSMALTQSGVTSWLSGELHLLHGVELALVVVLVVIALILVSEMMSNVATITAFLPILAALAGGLEVHPLVIMIPATLAASCAFMMPGASAPNAIAYGTGYLKVSEMVRTGGILNILCAIVIILAAFYLIPPLMGFDPNVIPDWAMPKDAISGTPNTVGN